MQTYYIVIFIIILYLNISNKNKMIFNIVLFEYLINDYNYYNNECFYNGK